MIKGAIFDVDGTLVDSMKFWDGVAASVVRKHGKIPEPDLGHIMLPLTMAEGGAYLKKTYGLEISVEEIVVEINETIRNFYANDAQLKPGAGRLIEILKKNNIPIIVASATDKPQVEVVFRHLGILDDLKAIMTCTDLNTTKYQPDIYLKSAELIGAQPDEVLVFEDAIHAAESAKNGGFILCGIYDEMNYDCQDRLQEISDYYIKSFEDFIDNSLAELKIAID